MATAPTATEKKKRKPQGPRTAKPKIVYILYKGQFEAPPEVVLDGGETLLDRVMNDRDLKVEKVVIPVKSRKPAAPAEGAATA